MSSKAFAYGGVVVDGGGRILLREPASHFGGYVWTFPKGRPQQSEANEQAALRETKEETGVVAEIVAPIDRVFEGDTTQNRYYLMRPTGLAHEPTDDETASICWAANPAKARALIAENRGTHADTLLEVLDAALEVAGQHSTLLGARAVVVDVRGQSPVPRRSGSMSDAEVAWRTRIKEEVEAMPLEATMAGPGAWFSAEFEFFVPSPLTDLDNLVKPVLDTLFLPGVDNPNRQHIAHLTGVLFRADDGRIRHLVVRKRQTLEVSEQGARITVRELIGPA
jgi:ADP-ribose pyrophosphatase YjhB (NUDIX family)